MALHSFYREAWPINPFSESHVYSFDDVLFTRDRPLLPQISERFLLLHTAPRFHAPLLVGHALFDALLAGMLLVGTAGFLNRRTVPRYSYTIRSLLMLHVVACLALGTIPWLCGVENAFRMLVGAVIIAATIACILRTVTLIRKTLAILFRHIAPPPLDNGWGTGIGSEKRRAKPAWSSE